MEALWRISNKCFTELTHFFSSVAGHIGIVCCTLFNRRYASSRVNTYVSAPGYFQRLASLRDPTKTFYISDMLKGYGKIG